MKSKTINALLVSGMILGSANALADIYKKGTYDSGASDKNTSTTHNDMSEKNMNKSNSRKTHMGMNSTDSIKRAQTMLNEKGFDAGNADGIVGTRTRSALMKFQRENDLSATGSLNRETLDKMNVDSNYKDENSNTYAE